MGLYNFIVCRCMFIQFCLRFILLPFKYFEEHEYDVYSYIETLSFALLENINFPGHTKYRIIKSFQLSK